MKHAPHLCICPFVPHPGVMRIPGPLQVVILVALVVHALAAGAQHMEITGLTTQAAVAPAKQLSSSHGMMPARTAMESMEGSPIPRAYNSWQSEREKFMGLAQVYPSSGISPHTILTTGLRLRPPAHSISKLEIASVI